MLRYVLPILLPWIILPALAEPEGNPADSLLAVGNGYRDRLLYDSAIASYGRAVEADTRNAEAWYQLALAYVETGNQEKALEAALQGSRLESPRLDDFSALTAAAYGHMMTIAFDYENLKNRSRQELDNYIEFCRTAENGAELFLGIGVTYWSMGNIEQATASFERAVWKDPAGPAAHLMLGRIYNVQGRRVPAMMAFGRYLMLEPTSAEAPRVRLLLGNLLRGLTLPADRRHGGDARLAAAERAVDEGAADVRRAEGSIEAYVTSIREMLTSLPAAPSEGGGEEFVMSNYLPFYLEIRKTGRTETFVRLLFRNDPAADTWIARNHLEVDALTRWSNDFHPPAAPFK